MNKHFEKFKLRMQAFESKKILLLLSGGVDSMVLAHFLIKIKDELNIEIGCFHLNHMYRGIDADNDAEFVRRFCVQNNLEHFIEKENINEIAKEKKLGFEVCARYVRLSLAQKIKNENSYDYLITAHHLDDSVESIVHNFIRGSGINGLTGIDFQNNFYLRPFIDLKKSEILEIAEELKIEFREDITNADTVFTRNQIRHKIIPEMLKINPNFKNTLTRTAKQIEEDRDFLDRLAFQTLNEISTSSSSMSVLAIDLIKFKELDIAIKKRIVRFVIEKFKGDLVDVYSSIIEEIINLSENKQSGKHLVFKNIVFEISRDKLLVYKEIEDEIEKLELKLGINDYNGNKIKVSKISFEDYKNTLVNKKNNKDSILLPISYLDKNLILRRRLSGDYIKPARLKGKRKLVKKLFVDLKLSKIEKSKQVLLSTNDEDINNVLWIAGREKSDIEFKIENDQNENFVLIELLNL